MDSLHDFAQKYLTTRSTMLAALALSAAAQGDHELADLYRAELERAVHVLRPEHLRVVDAPGSTPR